MVLEPDIYHTAAHRDDRAEIRMTGALVHLSLHFCRSGLVSHLTLTFASLGEGFSGHDRAD